MKSFSEIKEELYEIRSYYSMKDLFDAGAEIVSPSIIERNVEIYSNAVSKAPAQLYAFYIAYYVKNDKQVVIASDWGVTTQYVKILNRKLCEYFQQVLA